MLEQLTFDDVSAISHHCPQCGTGEAHTFDGDEFYAPGVYYICDCGCSTIRERISYKQWRERYETARLQKRDAAGAYAEAKQQYDRDLAHTAENINRKAGYSVQMSDDARAEDAAWREMVRLGNAMQAYLVRYEQED